MQKLPGANAGVYRYERRQIPHPRRASWVERRVSATAATDTGIAGSCTRDRSILGLSPAVHPYNVLLRV